MKRLLAFLLVTSMPAAALRAAEDNICLIEKPIDGLWTTAPGVLVRDHCSPMTADELQIIKRGGGSVVMRGHALLMVAVNSGPIEAV